MLACVSGWCRSRATSRRGVVGCQCETSPKLGLVAALNTLFSGRREPTTVSSLPMSQSAVCHCVTNPVIGLTTFALVVCIMLHYPVASTAIATQCRFGRYGCENGSPLRSVMDWKSHRSFHSSRAGGRHTRSLGSKHDIPIHLNWFEDILLLGTR